MHVRQALYHELCPQPIDTVFYSHVFLLFSLYLLPSSKAHMFFAMVLFPCKPKTGLQKLNRRAWGSAQ
jgi:hypothetical protein